MTVAETLMKFFLILHGSSVGVDQTFYVTNQEFIFNTKPLNELKNAIFITFENRYQ